MKLLPRFGLTALYALLAAAPAANADNWMARIDGDAYINQLSIPGVHDAATGHGFCGFMGTIAGNTTARTQDLELTALWEAGVRAFDLRPAVNGSSLEIYHGVCQTKLGMSQALATLCSLLDANPSEFALIVMRHETDGDGNSAAWAGMMADLFADPAIASHLCPYRPDLTVGELRGKIVALTRDSFSTSAAAKVNGWSHSADHSAQKYANATLNGATGWLYVQDFYDCTASGAADTKARLVTLMLDEAAALCTENAPVDRWVINHTSGYTTSASSKGNRNLAAIANAAAIERLAVNSKAPGPAGIVMMDFAGVDLSDNINVAGAELTRKLIDNNFRYRMRLVSDTPSDIRVPVESTPELISWITLTAPRRGSLSVSADPDRESAIHGAACEAAATDLAQWKLLRRADGSLDIVNRATGEYLDPASGAYNSALSTAPQSPAAGWVFTAAGATGLYAIHSGTSTQINLTQPELNSAIYNWYSPESGVPDLTDDGCLFALKVVATEEGTEEPSPSKIDAIEAAPSAPSDIRDLTGRPLRRITAPGIYIINGRKQAVR